MPKRDLSDARLIELLRDIEDSADAWASMLKRQGERQLPFPYIRGQARAAIAILERRQKQLR